MGEEQRFYRPTNGTEGMIFQEQFCNQCSRDQFDGETGEGDSCPILMHAISGTNYPAEWIYDDNDRPTCTAFLGPEPAQYRCPDTLDMFS